jgi:hypothetical protein
MPNDGLHAIGKQISTINVRISYRIIQLFSEGLYTSPNKALEELVSNSFDAGASNVHVILSPDLATSDASIVVIDDGVGMDENELRQHWVIGVSQKRTGDYRLLKGRAPIGKFGIGKLATYVLAKRLSHVTKRNGRYYSTSIDYTKIPAGEGGGLYTEKQVILPLRELTRDQAMQAVSPWLNGSKPGYSALKLFGSKPPKGSDSSRNVGAQGSRDHDSTWTTPIRFILRDAAPG